MMTGLVTPSTLAASTASPSASATALPSVAVAVTEYKNSSGRPPPPRDWLASSVTPSHGPTTSGTLSRASGGFAFTGAVIV